MEKIVTLMGVFFEGDSCATWHGVIVDRGEGFAGEMFDRHGVSAIGEVSLDEARGRLTFVKTCPHHGEPIRHEFARVGGDEWEGYYSGPVIGFTRCTLIRREPGYLLRPKRRAPAVSS